MKGRFLTLGVQNWQSIGSAASQRRAIIHCQAAGVGLIDFYLLFQRQRRSRVVIAKNQGKGNPPLRNGADDVSNRLFRLLLRMDTRAKP